MIAYQTLTIFFLASVALALSPGPDNIYVLSVSAFRGHIPGIMVTLGLCTGLLVHTAAVALGIAIIFQTSLLAFTLLKIAGAAYLVYLAWQAFRASRQNMAENIGNTLGFAQLYRRGIVMNVTNPKVSIFFLAFLPQFTNPAQGNLSLQLIILGLVFILAALLVFGSIALMAARLGRWLQQSEGIQRYLHWLTGGIFLALAVNLLITKQ